MSDDCGCVYSGYDGDGPSFSCTTTPRCRKPFKCCECRETVQVSQKYERISGKWDGRIDVFKTCLPCVEIRDLLFCEGFNYTNMWEDIREYFVAGGSPLGCIKKLEGVEARMKLSEAYRDFLGIPE